ncbi:flagellar biosynthesis protein FlhB [Paramaledivibacter caminithermalis]|jgi:flagellar biosynthetic protein FlhB|uniref:Flagellar biosynthetic protein FlhB n=1 Tax=Paramaledivibacter caminithermalis (strain DSM 15212 / CIP 107654 / DViRD3) TaxID=1121301 RepID=A0A1M6N792_PARC5|nr:flagellar biosynthesis protein FlhB [Paramaledivibacter caminithermalis]SHJ91416.1 flagellar biosynthetic protein FlhB [Paramaledivibacter caminithermalis DSM 15212]
MLKLRFDLQLFTGEKTEKPTAKRRKEARDKGQVHQSKDINSALILIFVFSSINLLKGYWYKEVYKFYHKVLNYTSDISSIYIFKNIVLFLNETLLLIVKLSLPLLLISLTVGIVCSYMQVGFLFTTKTLKPKLDKLNPIAGFKRMFSMKSLVELVKSLLKTTILLYISCSYLLKEYNNILNVFDMDLDQVIDYAWSLVFNITIRLGIALLILAILDYYYKKWEHEKGLKMSKQEVKEEYKQTEGDPKIKSKIKEKQRQIAMRRMMQDVPKADVVITNPTHFAVALTYNEDAHDAPKVIAKGQDLIAQNIKKIAKENDIPLFENKPLARRLYYTVDIGEFIPPDLYHSVAEILAYIYSLKNQ